VTAATVTVDDLERWVLFGARWRVVHLSDEHALVDFCACTGEAVERRETDDTTVIAYLRSVPPEPRTRN
jgi:hypothetical protein